MGGSRCNDFSGLKKTAAARIKFGSRLEVSGTSCHRSQRCLWTQLPAGFVESFADVGTRFTGRIKARSKQDSKPE
jgi:hypothetical protein